ncbi:MAG: replication protein RepA, partial [Pseudomonadota bacterium]|nr:replication protein RepA [Pseudomonadota bacterium]
MTLTRQQKHIIDAGTTIALDRPTDQDKAFLARQLVQTTLPHADPGNVPVWSRSNGNLTLSIQPGVANGSLIGFPYGTIPRLLTYWMTTEAIRTKTPRLVLGDTLSEFMEGLGLDHRGKGPRSDRIRLEEQMRRLFAARISFESSVEKDGQATHVTEYMQVARRTVYWW